MRRKQNLVQYVMILLFSLFMACKHEIPQPATIGGNGGGNGSGGNGGGGNGGGNNYTGNCDPDTIYFSQDILPLLISNCAKSGCHDPATHEEGIVLNSYQSVMNSDVVGNNLNHSDLYEVITENDPGDRMPPPPMPAFTSAQIAMIATWINQGAQDLTCTGGCDTTNVTWAGTIQPLIQTKCQGCHSGSAPSGGISLTNYSQVAAQAFNGKLLGSVSFSPGFYAMPKNSAQLPECEISMIRIWTNNGAPQ